MSLLAAAARLLGERGTGFALIGAAAMAVHGVSRATRDLDLLVVSRECLAPAYWDALSVSGIDVRVRAGDAADPLAGVIRLRAGEESPLDVIVGKSAWQAAVLGRAAEREIEGVTIPVASRADLILLKLYAGGHQDAWDIAQLLEGSEGLAAIAAVDREVAALPGDSRALWARIRPSGSGGRATSR